jgi:hypothetical protein
MFTGVPSTAVMVSFGSSSSSAGLNSALGAGLVGLQAQQVADDHLALFQFHRIARHLQGDEHRILLGRAHLPLARLYGLLRGLVARVLLLVAAQPRPRIVLHDPPVEHADPRLGDGDEVDLARGVVGGGARDLQPRLHRLGRSRHQRELHRPVTGDADGRLLRRVVLHPARLVDERAAGHETEDDRGEGGEDAHDGERHGPPAMAARRAPQPHRLRSGRLATGRRRTRRHRLKGGFRLRVRHPASLPEARHIAGASAAPVGTRPSGTISPTWTPPD